MSKTKKLIETTIPLDAINDVSAHDKMPGIGAHPKSIHWWWARLPLPSAKAILLLSLVDDPFYDSKLKDKSEEERGAIRKKLLKDINTVVRSDNKSAYSDFLKSYFENDNYCDLLPKVFDPFCGGGSVPIAAASLGLNGLGSDLNPVAVSVSKITTEIPKRFAQPGVHPRIEMRSEKPNLDISRDLQEYGEDILNSIIEEDGYLFPQAEATIGGKKQKVDITTWHWCRRTKCSNPACGYEVPLISTLWLCKKKNKKIWLNPKLNKTSKSIDFEVVSDSTQDPPSGSKIGRGSKFKCFACSHTLDSDYIKSSGEEKKIDFQLVALSGSLGRKGRFYLKADNRTVPEVAMRDLEWEVDGELANDPRSIWCVSYGLRNFKDLFTPRQYFTLVKLGQKISNIHGRIMDDAAKFLPSEDKNSFEDGGVGPRAYADAISMLLVCALDRLADFNCALTTWKASGEQQMQLFKRQSIPMVWDFAEANLFIKKAISWNSAVKLVADGIAATNYPNVGNVEVNQIDAAEGIKSLEKGEFIVSTDPPYYDNIPYANLSDFFYVWMRKILGPLSPKLFGTILVPKASELVASPYKFAGEQNAALMAKEHFESGFYSAFKDIKAKMNNDFPMTVYYAFKQEDDSGSAAKDSSVDLNTGWETFLNGIIGAGFQITATWPIRASQKWRMTSLTSNALASYIVLVCRPRDDNNKVVTLTEFMSELRIEMKEAFNLFNWHNIAPVDLAQVSLGPGIAVYSKYQKILQPSGEMLSVRKAISIISTIVDELVDDANFNTDNFTKWALLWFKQNGFEEADFGAAESLSKAKLISLAQAEKDFGLLKVKKKTVRLSTADENVTFFDKQGSPKISDFQLSLLLGETLLSSGIDGCAALLKEYPPNESYDDLLNLIFTIFRLAENRGENEVAKNLNALATSWTEIVKSVANLDQTNFQIDS